MEGLAELAFRRHHAQIYRYLRRRTGDPRTAEDLTQEVFLDATRALARAEELHPASMLAWLYTIAQRRLADQARRERRSVEQLPLEAAAEIGALEPEPELVQALTDAIRRLPLPQRQVVALKLVHGASFAETGAVLGVSEAAAKMRFQRALGSLHADLEQQAIPR